MVKMKHLTVGVVTV